MSADFPTNWHLNEIRMELYAMRCLVEEFFEQRGACQVAISEPAAIKADSLLFDTMSKKVKYTKAKGLKRTMYSADVKASVLHSVLQCNKTPEQAAEFYGVHPNTLRHWIGAATKGKT